MEADYRLVCLTLSAEAVAHFVVTSAGQEYRYAPLLQKQTWWNATTKDWHWWRFHGDFPLMRRGVEFNVLEIDAEGNGREPPPQGQKRKAFEAVETRSTSLATAMSDGDPSPKFYTVVHHEDVSIIQQSKKQCLRQQGLNASNPHVGFRVTKEAAYERAKQVFRGEVRSARYRVLALTLSAEAIARFTAASAGPKNSFASMLTKKTYKDGAEKDWGCGIIMATSRSMARASATSGWRPMSRTAREDGPGERLLGKSVRLWCGAF